MDQLWEMHLGINFCKKKKNESNNSETQISNLFWKIYKIIVNIFNIYLLILNNLLKVYIDVVF